LTWLKRVPPEKYLVPIVGVRNKEWEFIVNPIVDVSFGTFGQQDFAPAVRLARNLGEDRFIGIEYYADLGQIGNFLPLQERRKLLFLIPKGKDEHREQCYKYAERDD
jgi:hypothetical protein